MPRFSHNFSKKGNSYFITVLLILTFAISQKSEGQQKISFGKVSMEELQMTSYKGDTTAGAVILSDIGRLVGNEVKFTRHIRVKILKKSGLDWGNWVFNTPTRGDFKVHVFNLVNGEIVRDKVEGSSIYREEIIKGYERYKVFAPSVKVGSVIDISYFFYGIPFEWRFQERIPIQYSELTLEQTNYVTFSKTFFGFEKIEPLSSYRWCARSMPAFKIEPFLNDYSNYITKFEFQLETIGTPGRVPDRAGRLTYESFYYVHSTTWEKVIENLMEFSNFGGVLSACSFLNDFVNETKSKNLTVPEKINAAFIYVQQNIKWNGSKNLFASETRNNFLNNHTGNSAEINLILITLLNKLDITTHPVVLSTRENGLIQQHTATFNKLNYVIGYVRHEGLEMFVDATSENIIQGNLPPYCLNGQGLLVLKGPITWVDLNEKYTDTKKQFVSIDINKEGSAVAKINQELAGVGFLNWAEAQKAHNYDGEIQKNKLQNEYPDFEILSYEVSKKDIKTSSAKETMEVDISSQLVDAGEGLIFNPFVMFEYTKNPFKSEDRKYPVDLTCAKDLTTTVLVQIPKEFTVKSLPQSIRFSTPDGSASFIYLANANAAGLQFRALLKLQKHIFTETEYLELRQFFSEVLKKVNTPVELVKN